MDIRKIIREEIIEVLKKDALYEDIFDKSLIKKLKKIAELVNNWNSELNYGGGGGCMIFADKIQDKIGKNYPMIHFFGEDDDIDNHRDSWDKTKTSWNPYNYYWSHTAIKINDYLYDSEGFHTKDEIVKKFNLKNPIFIIDYDGKVANEIINYEDIVKDNYYNKIDDIIESLF